MESLPSRPYLGTDVEFFFTRNDKVIPANEFLPGKNNARKIGRYKGTCPGSSSILSLHYDGFQGELTSPETSCRGYALNHLRAGVAAILDLIKRRRCQIKTVSSLPVTKKQLNSVPEDVLEFGCEEDLIAWLGGRPNPLDVNPRTHMKRYAGTHIHIGTPEISAEEREEIRLYGLSSEVLADVLHDEDYKIRIVKVLDIILGNTMVMLDQEPESTERRKLYGKAGVYRSKPYGIEYRVLGAFILRHAMLYHLSFGLSRHAVRMVATNEDEELLDLIDPKDIIIALNTNNLELARKNWDKIKRFLARSMSKPKNLRGSYDFKPPTLAVRYVKKTFKEKYDKLLWDLKMTNTAQAIEFISEIGANNIFPDNLKEGWFIGKDYEGHSNRTSWKTGILWLLAKRGYLEEFYEWLKENPW